MMHIIIPTSITIHVPNKIQMIIMINDGERSGFCLMVVAMPAITSSDKNYNP